MDDVSQVSFQKPSNWINADETLVFSAPKYCDSTENKGAYINIGPEHKLDFHKFDAVPHPDIKPMVSPALYLWCDNGLKIYHCRHMRKTPSCQ